MPISIYVGFGTRGQEGDEGSGFETRHDATGMCDDHSPQWKGIEKVML